MHLAALVFLLDCYLSRVAQTKERDTKSQSCLVIEKPSWSLKRVKFQHFGHPSESLLFLFRSSQLSS